MTRQTSPTYRSTVSQMSCVVANQLIVIVYLIQTTVIKLGQSDVLFISQ